LKSKVSRRWRKQIPSDAIRSDGLTSVFVRCLQRLVRANVHAGLIGGVLAIRVGGEGVLGKRWQDESKTGERVSRQSDPVSAIATIKQ
jgi:hypothetical protein